MSSACKTVKWFPQPMKSVAMVKKPSAQLFKWRGEKELIFQMQTALNSEDNCPVPVQILQLDSSLSQYLETVTESLLLQRSSVHRLQVINVFNWFHSMQK